MKKDNNIDMPKLDKVYLFNELTKLKSKKEEIKKTKTLINFNELKSKLVILNNKKKRKRHIYFAIDTLIACILLVFIILTTQNLLDKKDIKDTENILNEIVTITEINNVIPTESIPEEEPSLYFKYLNYTLLDVNLDDLKQINNEVTGWIQVSNTNVNYPILKHSDNSYYLKHQLDGTYNTAGWVFMDYRNDKISDNNRNTIIYGHGLKNKAIFGSLKNVLNESWYKNESNLVIKTVDEENSYLWQIFSIYTLEDNNDYIETDFKDDNEFNYFLNKVKSRSIADFNVDLNTNDKILTLSTCYNNDSKLVIHAKMIEKA